jgi:NADH-quinone oxidoreductase subunit H
MLNWIRESVLILLSNTTFILICLYAFLSVIFIIFILLSISFLTLWERKLLSGIQRRQGPVFSGIAGILQPFADGLKLFTKTFNVPTGSFYYIFVGSSVLSLVLSIAPWTVLPFNKNFVFLDINCSLLLILFFSSLSRLVVTLSGWSSNSKYGILGSLRSGAQLVAYELPILLSLTPIFLLTSNLNINNIVLFSNFKFWFIFMFFITTIFFVCALAETNRAPFDLPEAESELVSGYNIEYSSMSFAVFFLSEYNHIITISFLISSIFLGGWDTFFCIDFLTTFQKEIFQTLAIVIKTCLVITLIICVRAVLPRYRITDLLVISWEVFVPLLLIVLLFTIYINVVNLSYDNIIIWFWEPYSQYAILLVVIFYSNIDVIVYTIVEYSYKIIPVKDLKEIKQFKEYKVNSRKIICLNFFRYFNLKNF